MPKSAILTRSITARHGGNAMNKKDQSGSATEPIKS